MRTIGFFPKHQILGVRMGQSLISPTLFYTQQGCVQGLHLTPLTDMKFSRVQENAQLHSKY